MTRLARRAFLGAAASLPLAFAAEPARATLLRGLPLPALVARSHQVLVLSALESHCRYADIGGRRAIVTETLLQVSEVVQQISPGPSRVTVRTLGGVLDGVGELVHGQAEFAPHAACLAFLVAAPDGSLWVTGMAQGHYPLTTADGEPALSASPHLPKLVDFEHSAVRALVRQRLSSARRLVLEASAR